MLVWRTRKAAATWSTGKYLPYSECIPSATDDFVDSHAHEEIPGTVDVQAVEGDDTAYGQALFPVPAEDPNDPLQVGSAISHVCRISCSPIGSGRSGKRTRCSSSVPCTRSSATARSSARLSTSRYMPKSSTCRQPRRLRPRVTLRSLLDVVSSSTSSDIGRADQLGCIILIPMYIKFGRRPTMLFSQLSVGDSSNLSTSWNETDIMV